MIDILIQFIPYYIFVWLFFSLALILWIIADRSAEQYGIPELMISTVLAMLVWPITMPIAILIVLRGYLDSRGEQ